MHNCSISIAYALTILQSCTKPSLLFLNKIQHIWQTTIFYNRYWLCHIATNHTIDLLCKSQNAPVPYPTMHHFVTEMCTCLHISVTKWCIVRYCLMHCGICNMGLLLWYNCFQCQAPLKYHSNARHTSSALSGTHYPFSYHSTFFIWVRTVSPQMTSVFCIPLLTMVVHFPQGSFDNTVKLQLRITHHRWCHLGTQNIGMISVKFIFQTI